MVAKAATTTIPIVFVSGEDPVRLGLVASLARPGGNLTGINFFNVELAAKRLALLRELVPGASRVAVLVNPANAVVRERAERRRKRRPRHGAANPSPQRQHQPRDRCGLRHPCARAGRRPFRRPDVFFIGRRVQLAKLAARHGFPRSIRYAEIVEAGGLMSYGTNMHGSYRQVGIYAGRILKGAKPADLPVVQATKFEFVINLKTARTRPRSAADAARPRRRGDRMM